MTMMGTISLKDKFRQSGDDNQFKADFMSKSEFNNVQLYLKQRKVEFATAFKKRSKYRGKSFTIILKGSPEKLDI